MKTCGTCRFWGAEREDDVPDHVSLFRVCGAIKHDAQFYTDDQNREGLEPYGGDVPRDADWRAAELAKYNGFRASERAAAADGSGYYGALKTRDDFGCILHEEGK